LNRALGDVPDVRNGREIIGRGDLDETHLDPLTHDVPVDGENIRGFRVDVEIRADGEGVLGSGVRDPDVGDSLEPGGTEGRILDIEIPVKTIAELSHSYYRGRFF
jgi:hypothetical protein